MKQYEVQFKWQGKCYREIITTNLESKARELVRGKYPGCTITATRKVSD